MESSLTSIGLVVIGRNEGERLKRCLRSIEDGVRHTVYVDSGSSDGSVEFARSLGIDVVNLDLSLPFTMARGRNAGFDRLLALEPTLEFVQFVDGDCELVSGYLPAALAAMKDNPQAVVVTGRRLERFPEASPYNRLCGLEWGSQLGEVSACGGDMLVRSQAFVDAGKFNPRMIAGEEPELCVRLRLAGGQILRIDQDMTWHDAAMFRFGQWWQRAKRGGHAYAEGADLQGHSRFRHKVRDVRSGLFWGGLLPIFALTCLLLAWWWPICWVGLLLVGLAYCLLAWRVYRGQRRAGLTAGDARLYAGHCVFSKFPCCLGILQYWRNRWRGQQSPLIEYKDVVSS